MSSQLATQFPWGWVFGALGLSLVVAGAALLILTILLSITLRRFLAGGILEARVKALLLKNTWFLAAVIAGAAISFFWHGDVTAGCLFLLSAGFLGVLHIPIVHDLTSDEAVVGRLSAHLWNRRYDIEKLQKMVSATTLEVAAASTGGVSGSEEPLDPKAMQLKKEIGQRFATEQFVEKALYGSGKGKGVDEMVEQAAKQAGPGMTGFNGVPVPGTGPGFMAGVAEFFALYVFSLAGFYIWLGLSSAAENILGWQRGALIGACAGLAVVIGRRLIRWLRLRRWQASCIVCGSATRSRVRVGQIRTHLCNDACEKELRRLYSLG